jgi:2-keto-4-pentenoate hydratase/2-oxohepta-3-ene-1,7-dioic acid hydratase in catechol pathway
VLGTWLSKDQVAQQESILFSLQRNNELVQQGDTNDLIFSFDKVISYISQFFTLQMGDLIFTGTPSGVGPVAIGDQLSGAIGEQTLFSFAIK